MDVDAFEGGAVDVGDKAQRKAIGILDCWGICSDAVVRGAVWISFNVCVQGSLF